MKRRRGEAHGGVGPTLHGPHPGFIRACSSTRAGQIALSVARRHFYNAFCRPQDEDRVTEREGEAAQGCIITGIPEKGAESRWMGRGRETRQSHCHGHESFQTREEEGGAKEETCSEKGETEQSGERCHCGGQEEDGHEDQKSQEAPSWTLDLVP